MATNAPPTPEADAAELRKHGLSDIADRLLAATGWQPNCPRVDAESLRPCEHRMHHYGPCRAVVPAVQTVIEWTETTRTERQEPVWQTLRYDGAGHVVPDEGVESDS